MALHRPSWTRFAAVALATATLVGCGVHGRTAPTATRAAVKGTAISQVDSGPLSLLTMPDDGVAPILAGIMGATKSVKLKIYMFTDHDDTTRIIQALCERAKAGVDVEVVLEVRPYIPPSAPDCAPVTQSPNAQAIAALQAGGVRVRYASPRFKFTHEKSLVVDDDTAYIMTCNFTNSGFNSNREYVVIDHVPADVQELLRVFAADWDSVPFKPAAGPLVLSPENSRTKLLQLIDGATKSLTIQVEYLTDPEVAQHLADRVKAGVDIKVMLSDLPPTGCGENDTMAQETQLLESSGVTQFQFTKALKMHAKAIVADGARAFVGSENLTANSLNNNREVGILLDDAILVGKLASTAAQDWVPAPAAAPAPTVETP